MRILLDNGHGKETSGKRSCDGRLLEYKYCREIVQRIKYELTELGYTVDIITPEEEDISLVKRVQRVNNICNKYGKDNCLFISVHCDAAPVSGWSNASGWTAWIANNASSKSKKLAQTLYKYAKAFGLQGNRSVPKDQYWTANYYVCTKTNCPAVLTENLFMTNKNEVNWLLSENGKTTITEIHVEAILDYIRNFG